MLELPPKALELFTAIPCNEHYVKWSDRVHAFYVFMGETMPDWLDGCAVAVNDGTLASSIAQWNNVLCHMFDHGVKFQIANCRSYWFIKRQTSKWATIEGEHKLIELCYVSLFGDTFSGHATEYFPANGLDDVRMALYTRVRNDWHCKASDIGYSVKDAIEANNDDEAYRQLKRELVSTTAPA